MEVINFIRFTTLIGFKKT